MKPIFVDPFAGKCIHGVPGAKIISGVRVNPECPLCKKEGK